VLQEGDELVAEALQGISIPQRAPRMSRTDTATVQIPFTWEADKALQRSQEESATLGEAHVHPGHVLLALLRRDDKVPRSGTGAVEMLEEQGVDVDSLRNRLIGLLKSRMLGRRFEDPGHA
jgi:hypothetical protein